MKFIPWIFTVAGILFLIINHFFGVELDTYMNPDLGPRSSLNEISVINLRQLMPIIVSLMVLISAIFVILSKGLTESEQKWAFGATGTIMGYWLQPE